VKIGQGVWHVAEDKKQEICHKTWYFIHLP